MEISTNDLQQHIRSVSQIYFLHNEEGNVVEFLSSLGSFRLNHLKKAIVEANSIASFFSLKGLKNNSSQFLEYQNGNPVLALKETGIFTNLPVSRLYSKKISDTLFMAHITASSALAGFKVLDKTGIVLLDMQTELVAGYDRSFAKLVALTEPCLGKPLSSIMTPSPLEQLSISSKDLPAPNSSEIPAFKFSFPKKGYQFEPLNTESSDWLFCIDVELNNGVDVFVLLGVKESADSDVDDAEGYFFGLEGTSSLPVIKRCGFIAARGKEPVICNNGRIRIAIVKMGNVLALDINGKREAVFEDCAFLHHTGGLFPSIVIKNSAARITGLSEKRERTSLLSAHTYGLCHGVKDTERTFHIEPYYSHGLSEGIYKQIGGFLVHDVSDLEKKNAAFAAALASEKKESERLRKKLKQKNSSIIIGESAPIVRLRNNAIRAAASDASILITGETGTGKGLLARFIHENSDRSENSFVHADLGSIPEPVLYSELFGHKKGAFTGAFTDRHGLVSTAEGGTLFLDEVANLSLNAQNALLRYLNDQTYVPLGAEKVLKSDVRIILATNANLEELVSSKQFREDLYYRVNSLKLFAPPLRDIKQDIPLLSAYALNLASKKNGLSVSTISKKAMRYLLSSQWPGNVRQLISVVERAAIMSNGRVIEKEDFEFSIEPEKIRKKRTPYKVRETEPEIIRAALEKSNGIVKDAAKSLGIDRRTLYLYLKNRGIDISDFRKGLSLFLSDK